MNNIHMRNLAGVVHGNLDVPFNPFLVLDIRRDFIVQDTLNCILAQDLSDLKKPLRVSSSPPLSKNVYTIIKSIIRSLKLAKRSLCIVSVSGKTCPNVVPQIPNTSDLLRNIQICQPRLLSR